MNTTEIPARLVRSLQSIAELLSALPANVWQQPQGDKWTIAQETEHLRLATQGTAFVLSTAGRSRWYPFRGESRSFDTIVEQYQAGLKANPGVNNPATLPADDSVQLSLSQQTANWENVTHTLSAVVADLPTEDLDAYTVWKHPLLGPVTVREMIYFTIHHTDHHYASLTRKAGV